MSRANKIEFAMIMPSMKYSKRLLRATFLEYYLTLLLNLKYPREGRYWRKDKCNLCCSISSLSVISSSFSRTVYFLVLAAFQKQKISLIFCQKVNSCIFYILLVISFLTESCSKFSIKLDMNKFNKMNYPIMSKLRKYAVEIQGSLWR